ncbi:hypothetical protein [Streptosporangium sp. NPDC023615]|uniref:hypothetical protein n=1 Tax=Streptosporangium sp. NPDC023615 TaxID=3154794 RepID=UPI003415846C
MKRIVAGLVAGLVLLTPLPARAAAPDPVKALRAQVVPGRGVKVSLVTHLSMDGERFATTRTDRVAGFREGGVVETDDSSTFSFRLDAGALKGPKAKEAREKAREEMKEYTLFPSLFIRTREATYASGGELIGRLPPGKKWVRGWSDAFSPADTTIDLLTPGTLRALLATASSVGPRSARGAIPVTGIPGRPFGGFPGSGEKAAWALWFDDRGRVTRLTATFSQRTNDDYVLGSRSDIRFSGWGSRLTVESPPEHLVVEAEDLPEADDPFEEAPATLRR